MIARPFIFRAQSSTLQSLVDKISQDLINDRVSINSILGLILTKYLMGFMCSHYGIQEIPLMIDEYMIYVGDYDYKKIFTYIKTGHYKRSISTMIAEP